MPSQQTGWIMDSRNMRQTRGSLRDAFRDRLDANVGLAIQLAVAPQQTLRSLKTDFGSASEYGWLTSEALVALAEEVLSQPPSIGPSAVERGGTAGGPGQTTPRTPATVPVAKPNHTVQNAGDFLSGYGAPFATSEPGPVSAELSLTANEQVYWSTTGSPYRATQKGSSGYFVETTDPYFNLVPIHPLSGGERIGAKLSVPAGLYPTPTEAHLFLVDPESYARQLAKLPTKSSELAQIVGGYYIDDGSAVDEDAGGRLIGDYKIDAAPSSLMPNALAMLSPANAYHITIGKSGSENAPTLVDNLGYQSFYDSAHPSPEISAVTLQAVGPCSNEISLDQLINGSGSTQGLQSILSGAVTSLCDKSEITRASINYLFGTPVLQRLESAIQSQFFLNVDLTLDLSAAGIGLGCSLRASALYDISVVDGRLIFSLDPSAIKVESYAGGGCEDINVPEWVIATPAWIAQADKLNLPPAVWATIFGPNSLVRGVLLPLFIRQEINQIIRSELSIPMGDYGAFFLTKAGIPLESDEAKQFRKYTTIACDPVNGTDRVELGNEEVPGDGHLLRSNGASKVHDAMALMCLLVRQGFSQTHTPNGPRYSLNQILSNPVPFLEPTFQPCSTLVSNPIKGMVANSDEQRLEMLLQSLRDVDNSGILKHWGCPTPCDPSENQEMSFDLTVANGVLQLRIDPTVPPSFASTGCKSTLSAVLGEKTLPTLPPVYPGEKIKTPSAAVAKYRKDLADYASVIGRFVTTDYDLDLAAAAPIINPAVADPTQSIITFYPPVRRVIMNPDSIEVVFFDSEDDWTNAALAARYALSGIDALGGSTGAEVNKDIQSHLGGSGGSELGPSAKAFCKYTRPTSNVFMRHWATMRFPEAEVDYRLQPAIICPPPTKPPSPPPGRECSDDFDCGGGPMSTSICVNGRCTWSGRGSLGWE